ncbi:VOC family protein [Streptomyces sp. AC627_RSS907]|uniref:VOC family protein n=1 Tax=Streptomyces sp. AC627_RSS907 TaxID=2823684 RepID=UPI0035AED4BC
MAGTAPGLLLVAAPDEHGGIGHAEPCRPGGGALVFGSTRHTGGVHGRMRAGTSAVCVVGDDVDAVHRRVVDAGGEVLEAPHEARFGPGAAAYVCTVRDSEGNVWAFGTYRGPAPEQGPGPRPEDPGPRPEDPGPTGRGPPL